MAEIKVRVAVFLIQICCFLHIIFAADESWLTELQKRMETLEKQGVMQNAMNLRQQQMLHKQDRQLADTNKLVIKLQKLLAAQTLQLEKQRDETENLNEQMNKLSTLVVERDAEIKVLTAGIADLKAELEVTKSNKDKTALRHTIVKMKASREDPVRSKRSLMNQDGSFAFHAVSDKHEISLQKHQTILFETVLLNIGEAYRPNHSLFIAKIPGVYLFSVSILSFTNHRSEYSAALVKNGGNLALVYGHGDSGRHDQGSVTAVTQLKAGDEVWVKLLWPPAGGSIYGGRYTTFTGVLLNNL